MSLTIVLSGPKVSEQQARNALAAERFDVDTTDHDYGMPALQSEQAETFVSVRGDDVDKAWDAVRPLGWSLRLHYETPAPTLPTVEQALQDRLAEYERRLAALESGMPLPPIRGGAVETPGFANQNSTYGAEQTRRAIASILQRGATIGSVTGGIVAAGDMLLTAPGSGMSVNVAPGEAWVPGSSAATQSGYYCRVSSTTNLAIAAADPSNPRVDRVSALITDSAYSGGTNTFAVAVETGTPTAGATLANLNGAAAAPTSSLTDGYVLVPATSTNVTNGNISNVAPLVIGALPGYAYVNGSGSTNALSGQWVEALAGATVTLPATVRGATVAISAAVTVTAASPVTVVGTSIIGTGLVAGTFKLGTPGAAVIMESDGANWCIISGQQDTGWVDVTPATNWANGVAGFYRAQSRTLGNLVYLRGGLKNNTGGTVGSGSTIATLATGAPASTINLSAATITTGGSVQTTAGTTNGTTYILDGIWWPLS